MSRVAVIFLRFLWLCMKFGSVSSARWVMDYEKHEGKKP